MELHECYECQRVVDAVVEGGFTKVALQFPDSMLPEAPAVYRCLYDLWKDKVITRQKEASNGQQPRSMLFFIIGDTSYGSCCVDEVAAQHLDADLVVHFGPACLSPTSRIPVLYVFGRRPLDVDACIDGLSRTITSRETFRRVLIFFDVAYNHHMSKVSEGLACQLGPGVVLALARIPREGAGLSGPVTGQCADDVGDTEDSRCRRCVIAGGLEIDIEEGNADATETVIAYVGPAEKQLANIMLRFNACPCVSYDPAREESEHVRWESATVNRELKRRYYMVQRAKDAAIIGVVVGTLGVSRYRRVVESLRLLIARAGKKAYTLAVGKVNPAKLANFSEVEVFCLVACPETSLLDSREFHAPIVTPLELEMALGGRTWDGFYSTDFRDLQMVTGDDRDVGGVSGSAAANGEAVEDGGEDGDDDDDDDRPYFSLVSGSFKSRADTSAVPVAKNTAAGHLIEYHSPAGDFLQSRLFRGLGQDGDIGGGAEAERPNGIVEGRVGIASDYGH